MNEGSLRYLTRQEIDTMSWDRCVAESTCPLIYAKCYYLDALTDQWDGIVYGDYEAVMPLPWRRKLIFRYVYGAPLVAQLGVFGQNLNDRLIAEFIQMARSKFSLMHLPLNVANKFGCTTPLASRKNYELLPDPANHRIGYRTLTRRKLAIANKIGIEIDTSGDTSQFYENVRMHTPGAEWLLRQRARIQAFLRSQLQNGNGRLYTAMHPGGQALGGAFVVYDDSRAYYLLAYNTPAGKGVGAPVALVDRIIEDCQSAGIVLDFEGGNDEGLAFFYGGFGAEAKVYPVLTKSFNPF